MKLLLDFTDYVDVSGKRYVSAEIVNVKKNKAIKKAVSQKKRRYTHTEAYLRKKATPSVTSEVST